MTESNRDFLSRRKLAFLLPAALAAADKPATPSFADPFEKMDVKTAANGNKTRQVIDAHTHTGYHFDLHETELAVGQAPHPPHHHDHEEMVMVQTGMLEVTISGKSTRLGPGSVGYVASNEEHGWKNVGDTSCNYFVMAFGRPG